MDFLVKNISIFSILIGGWSVVNGILHDVFVLRKYKTYDRELLRLLMDGHILVTCGILQLLAAGGFGEHNDWGFLVSIVASVSLLVYCGMIWPFLKSVITIIINLLLVVILLMYKFL